MVQDVCVVGDASATEYGIRGEQNLVGTVEVVIFFKKHAVVS